jgi:hypothetical protein
MTHADINADKQTEQPRVERKIVPTRIHFQRDGGLAIAADGSLAFIRDSGEEVPFLSENKVRSYDVALCLEPSNYELHIHSGMNGVLHVDGNGKLFSVFGPCVLPFLPAETAATLFGRIELDDGTTISFDHKGRLYGLPAVESNGCCVCREANDEHVDESIDLAELRLSMSTAMAPELREKVDHRKHRE